MPEVNMAELFEAIAIVENKGIPKVELKDGTKVYRVKNIIRIDMKIKEDN